MEGRQVLAPRRYHRRGLREVTRSVLGALTRRISRRFRRRRAFGGTLAGAEPPTSPSSIRSEPRPRPRTRQLGGLPIHQGPETVPFLARAALLIVLVDHSAVCLATIPVKSTVSWSSMALICMIIAPF